jgi:hypothetical protein
MVRSGASIVRTKRSGALLSAHLACALLAYFVNFATCALPKCASRAQNLQVAASANYPGVRWMLGFAQCVRLRFL